MLSHLVHVKSVLTDRLRRDDRGATLVEYGLLLALIAVVVIPALIALGLALLGMFNGVVGNL